jgi:hypothetical protein
MALTAPSINELFAGVPESERLDRFEAYKAALSACHQKALTGASRGEIRFERNVGIVKSGQAAVMDVIEKSVSPEQLAAVQSALATTDINKEWTLTNPLQGAPYTSIGLVPYDLQPALELLIPKTFILRNSIARVGAVGQALEFRRILGVSNARVGGVANLNTFFNSNTNTQSFNGVTLNRPNLISYSADRIVKPYVEQGVSDSVSLQAEFAGKGYTDLRQLSHTSAIWAHMLGEENNMLNAVSTALNISGASATAATDSTVTGSGLPSTSSAAVLVTFSSAAGESQAFSAGTVSGSAGAGVKLTSLVGVPAGTIAINIYVTVSSSSYYKGTTVLNNGASPTTFVSIGSTSAVLPSTSADNGSANGNVFGGGTAVGTSGYDGFISTFLTDSETGATAYKAAVNGYLSTAEPGAEFQNAFVSLFNSVQADPDWIITTAAIRRELAKSIQQQGSPTGYRLNYETGSDGFTIGSVVTAIANEATGKLVDVIAHRFMPAGVALVHSTQLPFPDSGVSTTVTANNVVDQMVIEWPQIGMSYDLSTYTYGTLAFHAPAWSGVLTGIL